MDRLCNISVIATTLPFGFHVLVASTLPFGIYVWSLLYIREIVALPVNVHYKEQVVVVIVTTIDAYSRCTVASSSSHWVGAQKL